MLYTSHGRYPVEYDPKGSRPSVPWLEEWTTLATQQFWRLLKSNITVLKSLQESAGKTWFKNGHLKEKGWDNTQILNKFNWFASRNLKMYFCKRSLLDFFFQRLMHLWKRSSGRSQHIAELIPSSRGLLLTISTILRLFWGVRKYVHVKKVLNSFCSSEESADFSLKTSILLLRSLVTPVVVTEVFNPELLGSWKQ